MQPNTSTQPTASVALDGVPPASYADAVAGVSRAITARYMVPGHKGRMAPPAMRRTYADIDSVYANDLPLHIRDVDITTDGASPLEQAQVNAAVAYGANTTRFGTNGGSGINLTTILTSAVLAGGRTPRVLAARNSHQSSVHGAILANADVVWLAPERHRTLDIDLGVTPASVEGALSQYGPFDLLLVVSPTYHGVVSDIAEIAAICRRHEITLAVDEAWGAHFAFHPNLPTPAIQAGADLVTSSTHKLAGSLTQSAMLLIGDKPRLVEAVDSAAALVATTSPSPLLRASLDAARENAQIDGVRLLQQAAAAADALRRGVDNIPCLSALDERLIEEYSSVAEFDPLRVTIDVTASGLRGFQIRDQLLSHRGRRIELEFCTDELIVALFGIGDTDLTAGAALLDALREIVGDRPAISVRRVRPTRPLASGPAVSLRDGFFGISNSVPLEAAAGRICAEVVAPYPPGIAVVLPGERLTEETVDYLLATRLGSSFSDCADHELTTVQVLTEDPCKEN